MSQMMMPSYPKQEKSSPPVTKMTAGDLCCVCRMDPQRLFPQCCGAPTEYGDGGPPECCGAHVWVPCPVCTHKTPAERVVEAALNGGRHVSIKRDDLGRMVREAWVRWAQTQTVQKPSWLVPYDELNEVDKEADRQIGEAVARWTLIFDAAALSHLGGSNG